jgi:hypothetical protein
MKKLRWVGTSIDGDSLCTHVRLSAGGAEEVGLRESLDVVRRSRKVGCEGSLRCEIWAERTFLWGQHLAFSSAYGLKQEHLSPRGSGVYVPVCSGSTRPLTKRTTAIAQACLAACISTEVNRLEVPAEPSRDLDRVSRSADRRECMRWMNVGQDGEAR